MRNELRQPRIRATLAGLTLAGLISAEIESNNHFAADRFRLRFASKIVQQELLHIPGAQIDVEIGFDDVLSTRIIGLIDSVSYNPITGVIDAEGRDLSSQLIETQTDDTFANQTASEIAVILGLRHGLLVLADPTTTPVGRYYQSEHDRLTLSQFAKTMTEWDLLAFLAVREGFDLFMVGRTIRFGMPVVTGATVLRPNDCMSLSLAHAVSLARPIDVLVRSWNSKTGDVATGEALSVGIGPVWQRKITRPNLTSAAAQQQAQRVVDDLKRHEWTASAIVPGSVDLTARSVVLLEGTASGWDRLYQVASISREIEVKRGFTQRISLQGIV